MDEILYLECLSGISGDMTVAALLDLGADEEVLRRALSSLPLSGFSVEIKRVVKSGLDVCDFNVVLDEAHENHDHDMEYLYGKGEHVHEGHSHGEHDHEGHSHIPEAHSHGEQHSITEEVHSHGEHHGHHHHHHEHRGLKEILHIIDHAEISDRAKETACRIFRILAEAESAAHGVPMEEVHFHEVGAVDSIVDIVAAAVCLDNLNITRAVVPVLCEGSGFVRCQHGMIPVPVPAVANIAGANGLKLKLMEIQGELVTPTGAAIVAAVKTDDKLPEAFTIVKTGMGAGKRSYERPSILRAMLIRGEESRKDTICKLETNIDDCTGEMLGYVMDRLFEEGARDVHYIPVFMKKNRPAYQLNVICSEEDADRLERVIFAETTTIGIRRLCMERTVLPREVIQVGTPLGQASVKVCRLEGENRYYPEYADAARLSREHKRPFMEVYEMIKAACPKKQDVQPAE